MNKTFISVLSICFTLILGSVTDAASLDSLQSQLQTQFSTLSAIQDRIREKESEMDNLTVVTAGLDNRESTNWIQHRRLVRHKAQLSTLSDEIVQLRQTRSEILQAIKPGSRDYYRILSDSLQMTLESLERPTEPEVHHRQLAALLQLKQRRDWLLQKQSLYSELPSPLKLSQNEFLAQLRNHPNREMILADLRALLNDKITEIDAVITAAKEEHYLRDRMDQFSSEMTAIAGEVSDINSKGGQLTEKGWHETNLSDSYANGLSSNSDRGSDTELLTQSHAEYAPAFYGKQPREIELYIDYLDSLRHSYQNMIKEIR